MQGEAGERGKTGIEDPLLSVEERHERATDEGGRFPREASTPSRFSLSFRPIETSSTSGDGEDARPVVHGVGGAWCAARACRCFHCQLVTSQDLQEKLGFGNVPTCRPWTAWVDPRRTSHLSTPHPHVRCIDHALHRRVRRGSRVPATGRDLRESGYEPGVVSVSNPRSPGLIGFDLPIKWGGKPEVRNEVAIVADRNGRQQVHERTTTTTWTHQTKNMGGKREKKRWWNRCRSDPIEDWEGGAWTELHRWVQQGKPWDELQKVIQNHKQDAKRADVRGMLPLHWAAAKKVKLEAFLMILDAYPEAAETEDKAGMLPIHWAACGETRKILQESTDAALKKHSNHQKGNADLSPFATNMMPSCPPEPHCSSDRHTLKLVAFAKGLLYRTGQLVRGKNRNQKQPLGSAGIFESYARTKYDHDRSQSNLSQTPNRGESVLSNKQATEQEQIIQHLAIKFPEGLAKHCTKCGSLPMHLAAATHCSAPALQLLSSLCPSSSQSKNAIGWTPLHCMARNGAGVKEIKTLIDAHPAALWSRDKFGMTPLHVAAANDASHCMLQVLINRYPSGLHLCDCYGMHPLHVAIESRATLCTLQLLLKAGSKSSKHADHEGMLPLHLAVHFKAPETFVQNLVEHNPDALLQTDGNGMTCLHHAVVRSCSTSMIGMLLKHGPEAVMVRDSTGMLPIHVAESSEIIEMLYPRTPFVNLLHRNFKGDRAECKPSVDPLKGVAATHRINVMNQKLVQEMSDALADVLPADLVHMCITPLLSCA